MREQKYQSIQLLRALAALMVVLFHSHLSFGPEERSQLWWWPGLSDHGALGVSLFFVISGFIIANSLDRPGFRLGRFAWRRAVRIYPLYWIVMLAGIGTYWWRGWFRVDVETLGAEGIVKSILILPQETSPFWNPGWSLEHELIFYAIAAVVAPVAGFWLLAFLMLALGVGGFWISGWDYHLFSDAQIYFGMGILAYLLRAADWRLAMALAIAFLGPAYAHLYGYGDYPYQIRSVCFACGYSALIVAFLGLEAKGWQVPRPWVAIGDASYSLYLWHWLLIPFIGLWRYQLGGSPELWRWILIGLSVAVALLSYRFIEKPVNAWGGKRRLTSTAQPDAAAGRAADA